MRLVLTDARAGSIEALHNLGFLNKCDNLLFKIDLLRPFWIFAAAVCRFMELHDQSLPLSGNLPDMFSDSERYVKIQTIYR